MNSRLYFPLLACFLFMGLSSGASPENVSYEKFREIAIMDDGRVKPLDTYARSILLQLSSKSTYRGKPAIEWLARVLFNPKAAMDDKVFRINDPDAAYALGIEPEKDNHYTFAQLDPAINKLSELAEAASKVEEKSRTPLETEFIHLGNSLNLYMGVTDAFLFDFPHPDFRVSDSILAGALGLIPREQPYSYWDIRSRMDKLFGIIGPMMMKGGNFGRNAATWTPLETAAFPLAKNFRNWTDHYQNYPLNIIPPSRDGGEMWLSPWNIVSTRNPDSGLGKSMASLKDMVASYNAGDAAGFDNAIDAFNVFAREEGTRTLSPWKIRMEIAYNDLDPFYRAEILYGLALAFSLLTLLFFRKLFYPLSLVFLTTGALVHIAGIGLRMTISGRPPITNLFETFVFVAAVGALLGLVMEFFSRKGIGLLVGSITALSVLLLSSRYSTDGDTIGVLVAVLNSNFWLTTHVITISLGYAGFCMAGVVGHVYILQTLVNRKAREKLDSLNRMTFGVLAFGFVFSFIGTVLGGVWADQSWGRFWGWDPKENGALMIVLWGAILFHARLGKMIDSLGMAVGTVFGIVIVMMAWFGINLLGVGLHSYGFTSGVANSLTVYVVAEALFLLITLFLIKRPKSNAL